MKSHEISNSIYIYTMLCEIKVMLIEFNKLVQKIA